MEGIEKSEALILKGADNPSFALITVKQQAIIEESIKLVRPWIESIVAETSGKPCTEESVKEVKRELADLRKKKKQFDENIKVVINELERPIKEIKASYKENVTNVFEHGEQIISRNVNEIEDGQKQICEQKCRDYFSELIASYNLPWLKFEDIGLKISLVEAKKETPSKHYDFISDTVTHILDDINSISMTEDGAEIIVEYKRNGFNLAKAMQAVQSRKEAAEAEQKRLESLRESKAKEAEAIAKVEAAVKATAPEVVSLQAPSVETVQEQPKEFYIRFWATPKQNEAIKPELKTLLEAFKREGITFK